MAESLRDRDARTIWHPFTHTSLEAPPLPLSRGEGAWLIDEEGKYYLDAISSWWVNLHGHSERTISNAIAEQANTLEHALFAGFTHKPAVELAERVLSELPKNQDKIFYSDNGSTAVEVALKMAIQFGENISSKRNKIVCLKNGYHGDTFGAMSVSERDTFTLPFLNYLFEVHYIHPPTNENCEQSVKELKELIATDKVLAFIYEPLTQGAGGMCMYSPENLNQLLEICAEKEVITIADEVMTGFGRTGSLFASLQPSTPPDIICLSKGITGGFLPLGATSCTEKIFNSFSKEDRKSFFFHGHSYTGNPLACAAGVASFDLLMKDECQKRIATISEKNVIATEDLSKDKKLSHVRSCGTILAADIGTEEDTNYLNPIRDRLYYFFLERGFILRPLGNVVYLMPPYCITDEELDSCYEVIQESTEADI